MRKNRLMTASLLAIAAMLVDAAQAARAQSFDATGVIVGGGGAISTTPGNTLIVADSPNMVINWTPNDISGTGPINFQPVNTTALFTNRDAADFAILNRIIPTNPARPIVFNGTVISQLQSAATPPVISRGGTLFFYSPGGILVSPTAVFNVGSLVLTSSDLNYDSISGAFGTGGTYNFLPANSGSSVEVQSGARITAGPTNAYVALIAPKVVNSGTITVDGSAVLVAADASTITFRPNGLFDIQIDQGTSAAGEVVTNDGTITGAAGAINAAHRIYVVAVPKNDAITLAIKGGSTLGFDIAGAADVDGNAVVLSAGYNVLAGAIDPVRAKNSGPFAADLAIGAVDATSKVTARATGQASLVVEGGSTANFASSFDLAGVSDPGSAGGDGAFVSVSGVGSTLDIKGDLAVTALDAGEVTAGGFTDSGRARIAVDGGNLAVGGNVDVNASRGPSIALDAIGGTASLEARNGAVVTIGKDLTVAADGAGKSNTDLSSSGPSKGTGGSARIGFDSDAAITVQGNLSVQAAGFGGTGETADTVGSDGIGGSVVIDGFGGTLTVTGTTLLDASGSGGDGYLCASCTVEGGSGTGGSAGIVSGAGATLDFGQAVVVDASGRGGASTGDQGKDGGAGIGGAGIIRSTGGTVIARAALSVLANGTGGDGALTNSSASGLPGTGGLGGDGVGGTAILTAGDIAEVGGGGSISVTGGTVVSAVGTGALGGSGGAGFGGTAAVTARGGTVNGAALSTRAFGIGAAGYNSGAGGLGRGGIAQVIAYSVTEGTTGVTFGTSAISARGSGGAGSSPEFITGPGGAGGAGTGGFVSALAEAGNATLQLGATTLNATGIGGNGGDGAAIGGIPNTGETGGAGGAGRGGIAQLGVVSGIDTGEVNTGSASFARTIVAANGNGGSGGAPSAADLTPGVAGQGGNAYGGAATLSVQGGAVTFSDDAQFQANSLGGSSTLGVGGNAFVGGTAGGDGLFAPLGVRLDVGSRPGHADQTGLLNANVLNFSAGASGGTGAAQGTASVLDHPLTFSVDGGTINATSLDFSAAGSFVPGTTASVIALSGGDTTLTGAFSFVTPGTLTAALGGAELFSGTALIAAGNWLEGDAPLGAVGTIHGTTSVTLQTGADLFAHLSAETGGSLAVAAGGRIRLDDLTASGAVLANAGTTLSLANVSAGTTVTALANGNATIGNVVSGTTADLESGAALSVGSINSGRSAHLDGASSVAIGGNIVSGDAITLISDGAITAQGLSAGLVSPSGAPGALYDITVFGQGALALGALSAAHDIKLFTPQAVNAGALSARDVAVLAGGAQSIGSISASARVLLAGYTMTPIGGNPLDGYDLGALFAAAPIGGIGPITLLGGSSAASLTAATAGNLSTRALTTTGRIDLQAGGTLSTGILTAGGGIAGAATGAMDLTSASAGNLLVLTGGGAITTGALAGANGVAVAGLAGVTTGNVGSTAGSVAVTAAGNLAVAAVAANGAATLASSGGNLTATGLVSAGGNASLGAGGTLSAAAITSGQSIQVDGKTSIALSGNAVAGDSIRLNSDGAITGTGLSAGLVSPSAISGASYTITVFGKGALTLGDLSAAHDIRLLTPQTVTAGALVGRDMVVLAAANQSIGSFAASGRVLFADYTMTPIGGDPLGEFDLEPIFAAPPIAATGSISVLGASSAGSLAARSVSDISTSALTTTRSATTTGVIFLRAGGALATGAIVAGDQLTARSGGTMDLVSVNAADLLSLDAGGALTTGNLFGGNGVSITGRAAVSAGAVVSGAGGTTISIDSSDAMNLVSANADDGQLLLDSGDVLTAGKLSGFSVNVRGGTFVTVGDVTSLAGTVDLTAANDLVTGAISSGDSITLRSSGGGMTTGDLTSFSGAIGIRTSLSASVGKVKAATGLSVDTGENMTLVSGSTDNGDLVLFAEQDITAGDLTAANARLLVTADGSATLGNLSAFGLSGIVGVDVSAGSTLSLGNAALVDGELRLTSGGAMTGGNLAASAGVLTVNSGGTFGGGALAGNDGIAVTAGGDTTLTGLAASAAGNVVFGVTGGLAARAIAADGLIGLTASGAITTGALTANGAITATSSGAMNLASASAFGLLTLDAGGAITTGALYGDLGLKITGLGAVTTGSVASGPGLSLSITSGGAMNLARVDAGGDLTLNAGGALTTGALTAQADTLVTGGDLVTLGKINVGLGKLTVNAADALQTGDITITDGLSLTSTTGDVTTGVLVSSNGAIGITAGGAVSAGNMFSFTGISVDAGTGMALGLGSTETGDLILAANGDITSGELVAANGRLQVTAGGSAALGNVSANGLVDGVGLNVSAAGALRLGSASVNVGELRLTSGGTLDASDLTALAGALTVNSGGDMTLTGLAASATGDVTFGAAGALTTRGVAAAGKIGLTATGAITTGDLGATGALAVSGSALELGNLVASTIGLTATAALSAGTVTAKSGEAALEAAGNLSVGAVTTSRAASLTSSAGNVVAGIVTAGGAVTAKSAGTLELASVDSGGLLKLDSGAALTAGNLTGGRGVVVNGLSAVTTGDVGGGEGTVLLTSATDLAAGAVTAVGGITVNARGNAGLASAASSFGNLVLDATNNLTTGDLTASGGRLLVSAGGAAALGNLTAAGLASSVGLRVSTGTRLTLGNATAGAGELRLTSGGAMTALDLAANGGALNLTAGGALSAGALGGRDRITLSAGGDTLLTGDAASSAGDVTLAVTGALDAQAISAANGLVSIQAKTSATTGKLTAAKGLTLTSDGALVTGDLQGLTVSVTGGSTLQSGAVTATGSALTLESVGDLAAGRVNATGAVSILSSGGKVTTQAINAGSDLLLSAVGDLQAGALTSGGSLNAGGANVSLGNVRAEQINVGADGSLALGTADATDGNAGFYANGALRTGAVTASGAIQMTGTAALTAADLTAGGSVLVSAGGDASLGALRSGSGTVELRSLGGSLKVGPIRAGTDLALAAANDIDVGDVNARDMLLLAGGDVRAASLVSPDGRILVANNTLVTLGGPVGEYNFDPVFAAPLRSTGGTLAVTGAISGGTFTAAVGGDAALLGVDASRSILVDSLGSVSLGGVWKAPQIEIRARDLVMPAGSGLNAGLTGTINLVSRNGAGMRIGDGLDGSVIPATGYTLDNAEWSRINSGSLNIFAVDGQGPVSILIGKLDVTGPDAGSTIDDPAGRVLFRTGDSPTASPSGTIRVTGSLKATGFRSGNALVFQTGRFQLASDTGSIAVLGKGDALSGAVQIDARDIHVASGSLLTRLAADPFFAGVEQALDADSAGGTEPVLRAGALGLTVGRTLYIQRSGTGGDPLGFEDPLDGFKVKLAGTTPITVIINGTFRTANGLVVGKDAWKLFKDSGVDLSGFTADSRLNGCLLNAATCGVVPPPPPPADPDPGIRNLIEVVKDPGLGETPPGDPEKDEAQSTSPILPPQTVLAVQPDALPGQIDEPIAGSGNPALTGAGIGMGGGAPQ